MYFQELNGKFQRHKMVTVAVSGQYSDIDSYTDEHFEILGKYVTQIHVLFLLNTIRFFN